MKSKSLITGGLLVASVALTGNAAMARPVHRHAAPHALAAPSAAPFGGDIGQIIPSVLGGIPVQYQGAVRHAMRGRPMRGSENSSDWSAGYDTNSPTDNSANDAAQAIQSMNDENALNASMAAAEAQNEAAQAAAIQTEINANN
ncbi:MAG TPA: hypothetical protein VGM09_07595 [Bradyrhizobium sp.]